MIREKDTMISALEESGVLDAMVKFDETKEARSRCSSLYGGTCGQDGRLSDIRTQRAP